MERPLLELLNEQDQVFKGGNEDALSRVQTGKD